MSLLSIKDLTITLPSGAERRHAIHQVSFTLNRGEILCLVGESGSGKSISAAAVMGLLPPALRIQSGTVQFEGRDLLRVSPNEMRHVRGARIGMIFQEPMTALNPLMRVGAQVEEALSVHGSTGVSRVLDLFAAVHLPDPKRLIRAWPHNLSGGQRQRVMIAMALALEPGVLIADEPTTALDVITQMQILRLIREIQERRGMGVLFITHDFGVVAEIADRVLVMQQGRIVEEGVAGQILHAPRHPYTKMLIDAVPHGAAAPGSSAADDVVLKVSNLQKTFQRGGGLFAHKAEVPAVSNVSFEIRRGETLGLVGESGSGKSTLARCIVKLVHPEAGEIRFRGTELRTLSSRGWKPFRKRIQFVFQDPIASLNPRRMVGDIIGEGLVTQGMSRAAARSRARELLRLVQLDPAAHERFPHEFSGGQRQRIGIARALAVDPELLIADEPVSALDVSVQAQIITLLQDLRKRLGLTMLFITHDLRVAAQVCDRIAVMEKGILVEQGDTREVFATPRHPYTRALLDSIPGREWSSPMTGVIA